MSETEPLTMKELEMMVDTFYENARELQQLLAAEKHKNKELNIENSDWLKIYRRLQSENAALKAEISRLQSLAQEPPHGA